VHARTDDGKPTWDAEVFGRIKAEIEKRCPVLLNWSTGGTAPSSGRLAHLELKPHIAALNMGSMNYAKWRREKKEFAFQFVFQNSFDEILTFARAITAAGAKAEMECFDVGHTASYRVLEDLGLIKKPYHFSFIMGVLGGIPASARHLAFQAQEIPPDSRWKVIGISRDQWPLCMAALSLGGDVRVGLEDNFYLPNGAMARSNGELVAAVIGMVRLAGREPTTIEETRQILWPQAAP
jgi:uncharacterized protein (DUF849 family)